MSLDDAWKENLLKAAQERNIVFSKTEVASIHAASPRSPLAQWVQRNHIAPGSALLSVEEVTLWQHLQEEEQLDLSTEDVDWISVPTTDEELQSAIADLNASTRSIERRSRVLEAQSALARELAVSETASSERKSRHRQYFDQKEAAELQHVKFANDQLFGTLRADLQEERDTVARDVKSVQATVAEALNADDRALDALNQHAASRPEVSLDFDALRKRAARLTDALHHFRVQAIKDRLDRIYLEALATCPSEVSKDISLDELQTVQADLGSLYAEIEDVATMLVSHDYSNKIESIISHIQQLSVEERGAHTELVLGKLSALTEKLDALSTRLENLQSRRLALHTLHSQCQTIAPDIATVSGSTRRNVAAQNSKNLAPSSPYDPEASYPATTALMRHFGLSWEGKGDSSRSLHDQVQSLVADLSRQSKNDMDQVLGITETAVKERQAVVDSLSDALNTQSGLDLERDLRALEELIAEARADLETETRRPPLTRE